MYFFSKKNSDIVFNSNSLEQAYLAILGDDLISAKEIFLQVDSPRARWGRALIGILSGYLEFYPTYFEIRNFLEIDMDFLLKNEKLDYIELLLGSIDLLVDINQEVFKYTARVMFENKFYNAAKKYLDKSKDVFYKDPELHYLYAKYYYKMKDYEKADFYLDECLSVIPDYYPAITFQKEISRYLA